MPPSLLDKPVRTTNNDFMTRYPILFGFRDLIAGNGFVAGVTVNGRALLVDEGDGYWMYGVNPGGAAAGGATASEAQSKFRDVYRSVLFDAAAEAVDFAAFKAEVERFFSETNEPPKTEWDEAVLEVRSGKVAADWLPKGRAESRVGAAVVLLDHPVPSANALDEAELAA
jgi:hypothetical protein